jgi:hypothetical protein
MKLSLSNPNHCLHCGRQLSLFHLMVDWLYCNNSHKSAHVRQVNSLALARLVATRPSSWEIRPEQDRREQPRPTEILVNVVNS